MILSKSQSLYVKQPVLVTGATGFVGGCLVRRLLEEGAVVSVLVRHAERLPSDLAARCRVVLGDLQNTQALTMALCDAAYVFHCAANVATWGRWQDYATANVQGVHALLTALETHGKSLRRLVHVSTLDVYGFPERPADEATPMRVLPFGYGESKRIGDLAVQERCMRAGVSFTVLRPGNIVGPGSPFVSRIGEALRSGCMLTVNGGHTHAGLLDVDNLVDVLLWAGTSLEAHQQVYNVRDPWNTCWIDYVHDLQRGLNVRGRVIDLSYNVAHLLAHICAAPFSWANLRHEPVLHPLIVQIFGRTCGHSIEKLLSHGARVGRLNYSQSLHRSLEWFSENRRLV